MPARPIRKLTAAIATATAFSLLLLAAKAGADDHGRSRRVLLLPSYVQECGSCHVAYPPGMLPAASWSRIMGGLERHYGTDASLDPQEVQRIAQWLRDHAGTGRDSAAAPPDDRITRSARFERKHRDIEAATWRLPSVRSAANCSACHSAAERGEFGERGLRMPEGLSDRQRAAWD